MKIPVKEILEIPKLMELFVKNDGDNDEPYRLLFNKLDDLNASEQDIEHRNYEMFFSKAVESEDGSCFLMLFNVKEEGATNKDVYGEYIYSSNGYFLKKRFRGVMADFVNIFAI